MRYPVIPPVVPLAPAILCLAVAGCVAGHATRPLELAVGGVASSCIVEHAGRVLAPGRLSELVHDAVAAKRPVRLGPGTGLTSWRCVGGVIYQLQMAGVSRVEFVESFPADPGDRQPGRR